MNVVFIVGAPRSGTTLLENIFGLHSDIAEWYEPYYVWEWYLAAGDSDVLPHTRLSPGVTAWIRRQYEIFAKNSRRGWVLDKTPQHAFNLGLLLTVFPRAKFIHIVRDGRDVTLSIRKEWEKRGSLVRRKSFLDLFRLVKKRMGWIPFWRFRLMWLWYEARDHFDPNPFRYLFGESVGYFNKKRWNGIPGWGPRFPGWREALSAYSPLEFNALQWVRSVEAIERAWPTIPEDNRYQLRYEDLLLSPRETIDGALSFLGLPADTDFFSRLPEIRAQNTHKWDRELTIEELARVMPILHPALCRHGYTAYRTPATEVGP